MKKPTFAERVARCADVFTVVNDRYRDDAARHSPPGAGRAAAPPGDGLAPALRPFSGVGK